MAIPRSVLITGANRGLGFEMVKQLAEAMSTGPSSTSVHRLFASCRDPDGPTGQDLQVLSKRYPDVITVIRLDVMDIGSIKQCAQQVGALLGAGGLNLLINNAAVHAQGTVQTTSPEDMQTAFNTNLLGPMTITKEFLPYLQAAAKASGIPGMSYNKAAVINISSKLGSIAATKDTFSAFAAISYRISKAGLNMLTMFSSMEFRKDEILFALLHPGWVRTAMGGKGGAIDAPESVEGLLRVMDSLTEEQSGAFLDYQGKPLSW